jgi:prepilin-type N-terminal cleavage/methylation domain-containing protein
MAVAERGYTLSEVLVVLAIAALLLTVSFSQAIGWIGNAECRGAVYSVQSFLQRARMEAVSRNRACHVHAGHRDAEDACPRSRRRRRATRMTSSMSDTTLPSKIGFARPDSGAAVTLP